MQDAMKRGLTNAAPIHLATVTILKSRRRVPADRGAPLLKYQELRSPLTTSLE